MQQITFEDPMQNAIKYGKKVFTLSRLWNRITKIAEMVFCYENCSDLLWEKIVLVIEKSFGGFEAEVLFAQ